MPQSVRAFGVRLVEHVDAGEIEVLGAHRVPTAAVVVDM
jgi:hypothetical protein